MLCGCYLYDLTDSTHCREYWLTHGFVRTCMMVLTHHEKLKPPIISENVANIWKFHRENPASDTAALTADADLLET
jgi:hypothetical protein